MHRAPTSLKMSDIYISCLDGQFFVFDLETVKRLRVDHNISGILAGTLPQVPQQSVFLGLPLQLLPEEAALLVFKRIARIVDEKATHAPLLAAVGDEAAVHDKVRDLELADPVSAVSTPAITADDQYRPVLVPESAISHLYGSAKFHVYKFLHDRAYFVSPGLRFGCHFLAYPGDPLRYHSHFLVRGLEWDEEFDLLDAIGSGRLGTGVKKAWVVGGLRKPAQPDTTATGQQEFVSFSIEWAGFG
ncbi:tRNA intron endonuclease [Lipomyces japonicus]|uniref:tRNA intron endonuclease n=1 Tax=Lipomyces japonicus TaxID=56871 RepID=UPI0034CDA709